MNIARDRGIESQVVPWALIKLLVIFAFVASWSVFVSLQYFGLNPLPSLFFLGKDGWCVGQNAVGLGVHCFGDFGFMLRASADENPWTGMNNYTAAGNAIFLPFRLVFEMTGSYSVALTTYLVASVLALSLPAILASKGWKNSTRIALIAGCLACYPFLFALDRGNSIVFVVPAIYGYLVALRQNHDSRAIWWVVAATLVKPQFILLSLIFVQRGKIKSLVLAIAMAILVNVAFFALWWKSFPTNIYQAATNILAYQHYQNPASPWPANVSLGRPAFWIEYVWRLASGGETKPSSLAGFISVEFSSVLATSVALTLLVLTLMLRADRLQATRAVNLVIIASLFTAVTYSYYLVFTVPVMLALLADSEVGIVSPRRPQHYWLLIALALSLIRFPLPLPFVSNSHTYLLTSAELVPFAFIGYLISTILPPIRFVPWKGIQQKESNPVGKPLQSESMV